MTLTAREMLRRLGAGETIADVCAAAGMTRPQFDAWWREETARRVPGTAGTRAAGVRQAVRIDRDRWGIPFIQADSDVDLWFGFGYAQAQDRLFQLDILRRRGSGRLAEVLGADGTNLDLLLRTVGFKNILELDLLARTIGVRRIAEAEWTRLSADVQGLLRAFSAGVNAVIDECKDQLPIEFDLLGYAPEPWSPIDCLTIEGDFRWYLTGRFPVIVIPELVKRRLGDGPLYRAFLENEHDEASILHPGEYPRGQCGAAPIGAAMYDPEAGIGSNNWVIGGQRTTTGKPLVGSDPHVPFDANSWWWEARLKGGSFHAAGMGYVGIPAIMFGRTERVAWGCTNNICSQRDLYLEKTDPAHPNCFLFDGQWEPARERVETIRIQGGAAVTKTIRLSRNGPIVDEILPPPARDTGPLAVKWVGAHEGGWLTALVGMNRARSAAELRAAMAPWAVPTFSIVYADAEGQIGYQGVGRIPIRDHWERGYRPGWDPAHQWRGFIPYAGMPAVVDPQRGWVATANNRPAPDDFPYPLAGTWSDGLRATRIRERIEAKDQLSRKDMEAMHHDALSVRGRRCVPALVRALAGSTDARMQQAVRFLKEWDFQMELDRVGATIFNVFFGIWTKAVVNERLAGEAAGLLAGGAGGLAARLLIEDWCGWFGAGTREATLHGAMVATLEALTAKLGPDPASWTWQRTHAMPLRHFLSGRGDLARLLDHGGHPVKGDVTTVCNTGFGGAWEARSGANYRMIADLAERPGLWAGDASSQSGHPGSPHYADQQQAWLAGEYHWITMDDAMATVTNATRLTLTPQ